MKIYDISQEVFGCRVYPGDPVPTKRLCSSIERGDGYNLTAFDMCAHNGTHVDAPRHFIGDGAAVDEIRLDAFVGRAYVARHSGVLDGADARRILKSAKAADAEAAKRILIGGDVEVSAEAAEVFAAAGILLLGNEPQTVGPAASPMQVHLTLLGAGVILLEGIVLEGVPEGVYLLSAAPLKLAGADGAPCRAVLMSCEE